MKTWLEIDATIAALREAVGQAHPRVAPGGDRGGNHVERKVRMLPVVDRTPCRRCGVRGDLGCAHRAASEPQLVAA